MVTKKDPFDLGLKWHFPDAGRYIFTFITLFVFLIIIYGNSFHSEWHFDDFPNIVRNSNVHTKILSWGNIKNTFYGIHQAQERVNRPFSYLTFGLNYYFGGTEVFGYHVVNFAIHYIASVFLFLLVYNTLKLPMLKGQFEKRAYAIALISTFLWATHPIQVTAVTYIVQRMASMTAMFYLMAMYFYLKGRVSLDKNTQVGFFTLCGFTAVLSFTSKENAAMLPISLFLYELFLIRGMTKENVKKTLKMSILPVLIVLILGLVYLDISSSLDTYKLRPFTLTERLLTEPRIILFYITLLFYPTSTRLTLLHDFEISKSLFTPWTTLFAILIIFFLIGMAFWASRKRPLISYCILFFFLNHLIEGSIFPLELMFEHRNYLPSAFFFVLVALFMVHVLDYFSYRRSMVALVCVATVLILTSHAHTTYLRNRVLRTEMSLWRDVAAKGPSLRRPHVNLSNALFMAGRTTEALSVLNKGMDSKPGPNLRSDALPAHNLGQYYLAIGELDKAMSLFKDALGSDPSIGQAYHGISKIMFFKGHLEDAERNVRRAISISMGPDTALYHRTLSVILLRSGRVNAAIKEALRARQLDDKLPEPLYILGEAYRIKKIWKRASYYFEEFLKSRPESLPAHIALIEIYGAIGEKFLENQHVFALMAGKGQKELIDVIKGFDAEMNFLGHERANAVLASVREILADEAHRQEALKDLVQERHGNDVRFQPLLEGTEPYLIGD